MERLTVNISFDESYQLYYIQGVPKNERHFKYI